MVFRQPKSPAGITLIEVMAAIVIISIAVLGTSGYRYYSALDARKASVQSTAARIALLLSENWRGRGYDRIDSYNPSAYLSSDMTIAVSSVGPDYPSGFDNRLGPYEIVVNDARYWAALFWRDDAEGLRTLNTVIAWAQCPTSSDSITLDKTFKLTTLVSD